MTLSSTLSRLSSARIVVVCVGAAVLVNAALYLLGGALGASYDFTSDGNPAHVDVATLSGFTAVPLAAGLFTMALLSARWNWATTPAMVLAVILALASIPAMPLAVDLDTTSAIALAACHVVVGAVAVLGIHALDTRSAASPHTRSWA